jgi:hypothetical protein
MYPCQADIQYTHTSAINLFAQWNILCLRIVRGTHADFLAVVYRAGVVRHWHDYFSQREMANVWQLRLHPCGGCVVGHKVSLFASQDETHSARIILHAQVMLGVLGITECCQIFEISDPNLVLAPFAILDHERHGHRSSFEMIHNLSSVVLFV